MADDTNSTTRLLDLDGPDAIAQRVREHGRDLIEAEDRHQHAPPETVRTARYKGHRITVRTTYSIEVDGVPVDGHLGVTNDGQVHYHAIPNLGFTSAIELVEKLIDTFPDDFSDMADDDERPSAHDHDHDDEEEIS